MLICTCYYTDVHRKYAKFKNSAIHIVLTYSHKVPSHLQPLVSKILHPVCVSMLIQILLKSLPDENNNVKEMFPIS